MAQKIRTTTPQRLTSDQLGKAWGVTRAAAKQMMDRPGAPPRGKDGKWDLLEANKFRAKRLETIANRKRCDNLGPLEAAKLQKLELECERLKRAIAREERKTVEVSEARQTMNEIADIFVSTMESFGSQVAALTKDAALVKQCEKLASETRDAIAERIERQAELWAQESTNSFETSPDESEADDA